MRVLYFGTYERRYPRNAQVVSCLRRAGVDVVEHHVSAWDDVEHKFSVGPGRLFRLARAEAALAARRPRGSFDAVIVGYPGHLDLLAARRAAKGRPVVFNPLVSLSDTLVGDRGRFREGSLAARALTRVDRSAFAAADVVVADTEAHAQLFSDLGARRVEVCFVGAEDDFFKPPWHDEDPFTALFVGKLIPLHGLETILAAAELAPEIRFRVVGSGQLEGVLAARPRNVSWVRWLPYAELPDDYRRCGCALGIFGTTTKAQRVIPNKVFQALACGAPVLTADTTAARELLDETSAVLVPPGQPDALSHAVRSLAEDREARERIGAAGRAAYEAHASEEILGARWRALLESLR